MASVHSAHVAAVVAVGADAAAAEALELVKIRQARLVTIARRRSCKNEGRQKAHGPYDKQQALPVSVLQSCQTMHMDAKSVVDRYSSLLHFRLRAMSIIQTESVYAASN